MYQELNKHFPRDISNIILSYHYRSSFNDVLKDINTIQYIKGVKRYSNGIFKGWTWGYYDKKLSATKYIIRHLKIGTFKKKLKLD